MLKYLKLFIFLILGYVHEFDVARTINEFALERKILVNEPKIIPVV